MCIYTFTLVTVICITVQIAQFPTEPITSDEIEGTDDPNGGQGATATQPSKK